MQVEGVGSRAEEVGLSLVMRGLPFFSASSSQKRKLSRCRKSVKVESRWESGGCYRVMGLWPFRIDLRTSSCHQWFGLCSVSCELGREVIKVLLFSNLEVVIQGNCLHLLVRVVVVVCKRLEYLLRRRVFVFKGAYSLSRLWEYVAHLVFFASELDLHINIPVFPLGGAIVSGFVLVRCLLSWWRLHVRSWF